MAGAKGAAGPALADSEAWQIQVDFWTAEVMAGAEGVAGLRLTSNTSQKVLQVQSAMSSVYIPHTNHS
jgi:hypothetical protein